MNHHLTHRGMRRVFDVNPWQEAAAATGRTLLLCSVQSQPRVLQHQQARGTVASTVTYLSIVDEMTHLDRRHATLLVHPQLGLIISGRGGSCLRHAEGLAVRKRMRRASSGLVLELVLWAMIQYRYRLEQGRLGLETSHPGTRPFVSFILLP